MGIPHSFADMETPNEHTHPIDGGLCRWWDVQPMGHLSNIQLDNIWHVAYTPKLNYGHTCHFKYQLSNARIANPWLEFQMQYKIVLVIVLQTLDLIGHVFRHPLTFLLG